MKKPEMKRCTVCRCILPRHLFSRSEWARPRSHICKMCAGKYGYRARMGKGEVIDRVTGADWLAALTYWGNKCALCGRADHINCDHWYPLGTQWSRGHTRLNIIPLCSGCNGVKGSMHPDEWLVDRFGVIEAAKKLAQIEAYFTHMMWHVEQPQWEKAPLKRAS